jgi:chromosome segregation ATPase
MLDLTKKQQEIEFKLNTFKALYEEVKSDRNKYVNLIQNSSQELAEYKERIKISQNELEILKNESSEKEKSLMRLSQSTKTVIHDRDKERKNLDKLELEKMKLIEKGIQQSNEIAKLNMITLSLQNDMLEIRKLYESSCESRNYMGVQLIDRNDEL